MQTGVILSDLVTESTCWLAIKAREAAKSLPLVELDPGNSVKQLILVRYAFDNHSREYHWKDIWKNIGGAFQAMWADSVSDNSSIAADITSAYRPQWAELHVIRLGIPASFKLYKESDAPYRMSETPQLTFEFPTSAKKKAKEFFVRLNIDPSNVAVIPFIQDKSQGVTAMLVDPQPNLSVNQTKSPFATLPEFDSTNFVKPLFE